TLTFELDKINETLKNPTFIKKKKGCSVVEIGTTVKIELDGGPMEVTILGDRDAETLNDTIAVDSPLAKALLNHEVGSTVAVETPSGPHRVKILSIS
ncbi:MAG: GreA/GreB family elongation factor, partial [Candidatus Cloacimonetes bacterium]|nr:GreA/GreB family elongation factor [Candidatus Cloacimonadota bacterium]